jgi:hypothetical protein
MFTFCVDFCDKNAVSSTSKVIFGGQCLDSFHNSMCDYPSHLALDWLMKKMHFYSHHGFLENEDEYSRATKYRTEILDNISVFISDILLRYTKDEMIRLTSKMEFVVVSSVVGLHKLSYFFVEDKNRDCVCMCIEGHGLILEDIKIGKEITASDSLFVHVQGDQRYLRAHVSSSISLGNRSWKICSGCLRIGLETMQRCCRCKNAWYCSLKCQKLDWKEHRHRRVCR